MNENSDEPFAYVACAACGCVRIAMTAGRAMQDHLQEVVAGVIKGVSQAEYQALPWKCDACEKPNTLKGEACKP